MTITAERSSLNSSSVLLPYYLGIIAGLVVIHAVIAFSGSAITVLSALLLAALALAAGIYLWMRRHDIARIRFGSLVAHVALFVPVVASYSLHAAVIGMRDPAGAADTLLGSPWFGAVFLTTGLWGLGLMLHLVASIAQRGWEDRR